MVFVLFVLPATLALAKTAIEVGHKLLDVRDAVRCVQQFKGEEEVALVGLDLVLPKEQARELLSDPRVTKGSLAAQQLKAIQALASCGQCGRVHA